MEKIEKDIKNLEMIKDMIDTEYGKGKEYVESIDNIINYIKSK